MKIYVASSWRNGRTGEVIDALRHAGHEVYDFKNPAPGNTGFHWSEIEPDWNKWTPEQFRKSLNHPLAEEGFNADFSAMIRADACVLVLPCGRSAHLEAGYFVGSGKPLFILLSDGEPELMYKMANCLCTDIHELMDVIEMAGSINRCGRRNPMSEENDNACKRCKGCGQIANSEDGEPWIYWERLPPGSDLAVKLGVVKPIECPICKGTGKQKPE